MLNLVHFTVNALAAANVYGLANITIGYSDIILAYIVAIVVSIIVALLLRVPLLPSDRYSFDVSAIYPTPIQECFNAVDWLLDKQDIYNIDTENILIAGESAGG